MLTWLGYGNVQKNDNADSEEDSTENLFYRNENPSKTLCFFVVQDS